MTQHRYQSYQIHILLNKAVSLTVGQLGTFSFPAGRYVYTGSAKTNMEARIRRHLSKKKRMRWHLDYLLASPQTSVVRVNLFREEECERNQKIRGRILAAGFGSSDCENQCGSHLKFFTAGNLK